MKDSKVLLCASIGNVMEWYDFSLYGFMAPFLVKIFFPDVHAWQGLIFTFFIFAASYFMRLVGGAIYGRYADTIGRRKILFLSMVMIGVPSFVVGLLPTYASIGVWASALLLILRLFQGLSAGGEIGCSTTYLVEMAKPKQRGFYGSVVIAAAMLGVLLAAFTSFAVTNFWDHQFMILYGWRIPFLLSIFVSAFGVYIRYFMPESPVFESLRETPFLTMSPIKTALSNKLYSIVRVAIVVLIGAVINSQYIIFLPTYLHVYRHFPVVNTLLMSAVSLLVVVCCALLAGCFSNKFSRRKAMLLICILVALLAYPASIVVTTGSLPQILLMQIIFAILEGSYFGMQMAYVTELFPAMIRATSVSIGYNVGFALFAGLTPLLSTYFLHISTASVAFTAVILVAAVLSFLGLFLTQREAIVFIPGLCFGSDLWKYQKEYFRDSKLCHNILVKYNSLQKNVDYILSQVKSHKFSIAGHSSLGAGVALAVAAAAPERVEKVICIPGWVKTNQFTRDFLLNSLQQIQHGEFRLFKETLRNAALGEKLDNRNKIMREIHAVQDVVPMNQAIHQCKLLLNDINITSLLSDIKAEVMVIQNSEGDPWLSKDDALLLVSSLAASVNVYINNKSHLAPYTSPDKINSLIEIWV